MSGRPYALGTRRSEDGDRLAVLTAAGVHDLARLVPDAPAEMRSLIEAWGAIGRHIQAAVDASGPDTALVVEEVRWRAPIRYPWNLVCVAANYRSHADEMGVGQAIDPDTEDPVFFAKSPRNCIIDPGEAYTIPDGRNIDWEGELALDIGEDASGVDLDHATAHIFGYTIAFDVSDRGGAGRPINGMFPPPYWLRGKSRDGAAPLGPVIVPREHFPQARAAHIVTRLNGVVVQDGSTERLIFDERYLIRALSSIMTLRPGDVVLTGTPDGVGVARTPPRFLAPGDEVTITIDGIGTLRTPIAGAHRDDASPPHP
jgi:2-keto-4-pentenoate hydratase/2-oxohepta-3-ene-1,7-dioic acid hydratase in catechol pathway